MWLAFAFATLQASGDFDTVLCERDTKVVADKAFPNFQVFMQNEFSKHHKQNKSTAKSVGHGNTISITHKKIKQVDILEAQAIICQNSQTAYKNDN